MKNSNWKVLLMILLAVSCFNLHISFARPRAVKMDAVLRKRLTILFQDIASTPMPNFRNGKISNVALIEFGIFHNALRSGRRFETVRRGSFDARIAAKYIESSVSKYFGRRIKHQSAATTGSRNGWNFRNGYYYVMSESFEQIGPYPIRNLKLMDTGNGLYTAYADATEPMDESVTRQSITLRKLTSKGQSRFAVTGYSGAR